MILLCPLEARNSPSIFMCSPTWKRSTTCPFGILWRLLWRHDWSNHWPMVIELHLQSFYLPGRRERGRERPESSKPLITWLILLATSPQEGIQNHLHWMNKRYLDHSQHLGNSEGLGSCEPKTVDKDKTLYKSQYCRVDYNLTWTLWEWKWALLIIRSR